MKRWKIVYDKYCNAVERLYAVVQSYFKYSLVCGTTEDKAFNTIYIGVDKSLKGFKIAVSEAEDENQRIEITAENEINLLYAVSDFKNICLKKIKGDGELFVTPMKKYELETAPRIKQRGLWTWGYVIYDYKKYIDNMVKLKLNTLIIWNDYLPVNVNDVISYAHENGVKLYLGFAWGWDNHCNKTENILHAERITKEVINTYKNEYKDLDCDGIYFQSFTELVEETLQGMPVAQTVTEFVNKTSNEILKINENLEILFGLHATSVKNKLDIIKNVDNRISIIWEDLGAFPYSYFPDNTEGFEETKELNLKVQNLREGGFGAVLKGIYCLDWSKFEHQQGSFILGVSEKDFLKKKAEEKKDIIRKIQSDWIRNAKYAHELIKDFNKDAMVTVLVEDGAFEEIINYPVALYAQMLWDSDRSLEDIMYDTAHMPDVEFV